MQLLVALEVCPLSILLLLRGPGPGHSTRHWPGWKWPLERLPCVSALFSRLMHDGRRTRDGSGWFYREREREKVLTCCFPFRLWNSVFHPLTRRCGSYLLTSLTDLDGCMLYSLDCAVWSLTNHRYPYAISTGSYGKWYTNRRTLRTAR